MSDFTSYYNELKENPNNISYWYPKIKIKNSGINVPITKIFTVPEEIVKCFFMEGKQEENIDKVYQWVKTEVMPGLPEELRGLIFIKNGAFSNKFDFKTCAIQSNTAAITQSLIEINYTSFMLGTGGNAEFAIRERILHKTDMTPCIYNGMPLRNEYRVFYDFDKKKALYCANYWDWNYCYNSISRDATDKIVYEAAYESLAQRYVENKNYIMELVEESMKNVTEFNGIWSVDIMEDEYGLCWLIDMALGHQSAYWDPEKAGMADENHI